MPARSTAKTELPLIEIFSSVQGEGPWVGERQVFVRLPDCNLDCGYCDTPFGETACCRVEREPGSTLQERWTNPVELPALLSLLDDWLVRRGIVHHSLSLTGGEPLMHAEGLLDWAPELSRRLPLYLETNGTLPGELERLLPWLSYISMDLKLPSVAGQGDLWEQHREFLRLARQKKAYAKAVVSPETDPADLMAAAALMKEEGGAMPLVLQPATVDGRIGVSASRMLQLFEQVGRIYPHLRIIPQVHRFCGLL